ncbi:transposase [Streptomyces cucumeris]|uniref:transposase n=1 Tax=Streptomyces cucumeris TaxID=2962890 RepID=UPI003D733E67
MDIDAAVATRHLEKEQAAVAHQRGFGYHPILCFLDSTGDALADLLRAGNARANTEAGHIAVLLAEPTTPSRGRTGRTTPQQ